MKGRTVPQTSVAWVMLQVVLGLLPGSIFMLWYFGWGVLVHMAIACVAALACEAGMLALRGRPIKPALGDLSALVTALLLALAVPPLAPWWIAVIGTAFAIVVAKHLYGGLGYNPFNPAMAGYVVLLISFPREMTLWLAPNPLFESGRSLTETVLAIFSGQAVLLFDDITMATPLDQVKTQLGLGRTSAEILSAPLFGAFGARGWEWINGAFLLGGLWLLYRRVIGWRIPLAVLGGISITAALFFALDAYAYASPLFHLCSGGAMIGAFFIATDPVSASVTPRGKLIFGAGVGVLTYVIRTWGGYPDGIAFAVLLMNMASPAIDYYTRPRRQPEE